MTSSLVKLARALAAARCSTSATRRSQLGYKIMLSLYSCSGLMTLGPRPSGRGLRCFCMARSKL